MGFAAFGVVLTKKMSSLLVEPRKKRIAGRGARRVIPLYARDVDPPTAKLLQSLAGAADPMSRAI